MAVSFGVMDAESPPKLGKVSLGDEKTGTASLPSVVHPNLMGMLDLDTDIWTTLKPAHKTFVQQFNNSVRFKDFQEPSPPAGVTVGAKQDDQRGNKDSPCFPRRPC